jgi:PAS domain S-box-containing protein
MNSKMGHEEQIKHLSNFVASTNLYSIILTDVKGKIVFFNKGAEELFGYKPKEVVDKKKISEFIAKHLPEKEFVNFLKYVAEKGKYFRDISMLKKNRREFPVSFRLAPIKNDSGKVVGFVSFARDLSYISKIDKEIRNVKNMLEIMFDSISDDVTIIDRKFRIVRANKSLMERLGKGSYDSVLNCKCHDLMRGVKTNCEQCPAKMTFSSGRPCSQVFEKRAKDGSTKFFEVHTYPIVNKEGKVVQVIHQTGDITARKTLENKVMKQNAMLLLIQEIGESMHSSELLDDLLSKILNSILKLGFNRAAIYLKSESDSTLKGVMSIGFKKDIVKNISIPITLGTNSLVSQVFTKKKPIFVKNIFDTKGKLFILKEWLETFEGDSILAVPLIIEDAVIGMLTVDMRDKEMNVDEDEMKIVELFANDAAIAISRATLTEKMKNFNEKLKAKVNEATAELSMKNRKLEELDRMKNQFLSTISHELKTPLTSIKGYASLLKSEKLGALSVEQKKGIEIVDEEAQRLNELITNLLDLAKLETGKVQLKLERTDMNELIHSVITELKKEADEKAVKIKFNPSVLQKIKLDPKLIELALKNIISNAIKYNREKGQVEVSAKEENSKIVVSVSDTGRGIEKDRLVELFNKFHQLDEHMVRYAGGTGIGLAIVKSVLEKHNGIIDVKSTAGKGTAVTFSLPTKLIIESDLEESYRLKRTIDELKSIRAIFNIMYSEKSLDDMLSLILEEINKTLCFDRIRLYLLDSDGKKLRGVAAIGTPDIKNVVADAKALDNFNMLKSVMNSRQAEIVDFSDNSNALDRPDFAYKIALMPLVVKEKVIGSIAADNLYSKREISEDELKALTLFGKSVAIKIENFRLYEDTDRKVKERTSQLLRANRQKDEFLSYVSHEMRTPLTALLGYSKLMLSKEMDKETIKSSLNIIYTESQRLRDMINNLLDLSKLEAGKMKLDKSEADVVSIARTVLELAKAQANQKGLKLVLDAKNPSKVICDKNKIEQVMLNIISNAIKFTQKGQVKLIVRDKPNYVEVEVRDTGIGIAKEDYSKVFAKFEQIKNELKKEKGTGLGMPISKQLVEMHNGKMWIESKLGKGSSFFFTLPKN